MREPPVLTPGLLPDLPGRTSRPVLGRALGRRAAHRLILTLAALALLPGLLGGALNPYDRLALPGLLAALLLGVLGLSVPRFPAQPPLLLAVVGGWLYLLGHLSFLLAGPGATSAVLAPLALWVPVLLASHLWLLGHTGGRRASRAALFGLLAVLMAAAAQRPELLTSGAGTLMAQMLLAGLVVLAGQRAGLHQMREEARAARLGHGSGEARDPLTGLSGPGAVAGWLRAAPPRRLVGLAVAVIEVDHLNEARELQGEAFAGRLSAHVARVLEGGVRDEDLLGVLGDGAFAALLRVPDERTARVACERLRLRVASRPLEGVNLTVSVGIAYHTPDQDGPALLAAAREALNQSRRQGVNRVHLAAPPVLAAM